MNYQIGVFGSAAGEMTPESLKAAKEIGDYIASRNACLITGGCTGIPYAAACEAYSRGSVVGISPASSLKEHVELYQFPTKEFDCLIFTGMGKKGRNPISIHSCDAAIFIGGRIGTLNEFTIAYDEGKIIGILTGSGGLSDRYVEIAKESGKESKAVIIEDNNPLSLIVHIFEALETRK